MKLGGGTTVRDLKLCDDGTDARRFAFLPDAPDRGLISGMASAGEYRSLAEQCFALAQKATDPDDRARLIQMAQSWRELADRLETRQSEKE